MKIIDHSTLIYDKVNRYD